MYQPRGIESRKQKDEIDSTNRKEERSRIFRFYFLGQEFIDRYLRQICISPANVLDALDQSGAFVSIGYRGAFSANAENFEHMRFDHKAVALFDSL